VQHVVIGHPWMSVSANQHGQGEGCGSRHSFHLGQDRSLGYTVKEWGLVSCTTDPTAPGKTGSDRKRLDEMRQG
jgi:hypothetical protein